MYPFTRELTFCLLRFLHFVLLVNVHDLVGRRYRGIEEVTASGQSRHPFLLSTVKPKKWNSFLNVDAWGCECVVNVDDH